MVPQQARCACVPPIWEEARRAGAPAQSQTRSVFCGPITTKFGPTVRSAPVHPPRKRRRSDLPSPPPGSPEGTSPNLTTGTTIGGRSVPPGRDRERGAREDVRFGEALGGSCVTTRPCCARPSAAEGCWEICAPASPPGGARVPAGNRSLRAASGGCGVIYTFATPRASRRGCHHCRAQH